MIYLASERTCIHGHTRSPVLNTLPDVLRYRGKLSIVKAAHRNVLTIDFLMLSFHHDLPHPIVLQHIIDFILSVFG